MWMTFLRSEYFHALSLSALRWSIVMFGLNMGIGTITVFHSVTLTALGYGLLGYLMVPFMLKLLISHMNLAPSEIMQAVVGPTAAGASMSIAIILFGRVLADHMRDLAILMVIICLGAVIYIGLSFFISRPQVMAIRKLLFGLLPKRP